ncbi:MAG: hypothetical protein EBZ77_11250 [Chitinophagia bacterium]|nr:hypothetical protein [Chitinophagia bacterium]
MTLFGDYASTVSYATAETTIACVGDIAETVRARQTGEIIASVVLILANITAGNDSAVVVSADSLERLVVARFGTCLVPKTMLSAIVALARAKSDIRDVFARYLENMRLMGSITHRFAACLLAQPQPSFGTILLLGDFPKVSKDPTNKKIYRGLKEKKTRKPENRKEKRKEKRKE